MLESVLDVVERSSICRQLTCRFQSRDHGADRFHCGAREYRLGDEVLNAVDEIPQCSGYARLFVLRITPRIVFFQTIWVGKADWIVFDIRDTVDPAC